MTAEPDEGAFDDLGTAAGAGGVTIGGYQRERDPEQGAFAGKGHRVRSRLDKRRGTQQVVRGRWRAHLHGFSCNYCGTSTTTDRGDQARHDRHHEEEDEFRAKLEADNQHMHAAILELAARNRELAEAYEMQSARLDALMIGLGHADDAALEAVVGKVAGFLEGGGDGKG
jgi:hypothetical protein